MDWREFIASVIDSLAWPVALVVLGVLVRERLADLLSGPLRRLKVGPTGAELEWQEIAAEVRVSSARALPAPPTALDDDSEEAELTHLDGLAERDPVEAIVQSANIVMGEVRRLVEARNVELPPDHAGHHALVKAAYRGEVISRDTAESLRGLLVLRDLAAHGPGETSVAKAVDYIVLARAVLYALSRA